MKNQEIRVLFILQRSNAFHAASFSPTSLGGQQTPPTAPGPVTARERRGEKQIPRGKSARHCMAAADHQAGLKFMFRGILTLIVFCSIALFLPQTVQGATYYVDASNGLDTNDGLSSSTAWKTLAKVNSLPYANTSFETPVISSYIYNPTGGTWAFTGNSGIQHNGSAWGAANAPDGTQTAFLQGNGSLGSISQSFSFTSGTYTVSFYAARRSSSIQPIQVSVDGTAVGTYTPASTSFAQMTTAAFTVAAGSHTVTFAATDNSSDKTSFIDNVTIAQVGGSTIIPGNSVLISPGDSVLFKRGEVWREQLTIPSSGSSGSPITIGAYGDGANPEINGADIITGWSVYSGNIYVANVGSEVTQLFVDGARQTRARWPNSGWNNIDATTTGSISLYSNSLTQSDNYWAGATIVVKTVPWAINARTVVSNTGNTITWNSATKFSSPSKNYGFYLEGIVGAIDIPGEWCYSAGKLYLMMETGDNPANHLIEGSVRAHGIMVSGRQYINVENTTVKYAGVKFENASSVRYDGIRVESSNNINLNSNNILFTGVGIMVQSSNYIYVDGNAISETTDTAIRMYGSGVSCHGEITNNQLTDIASYQGSPRQGPGIDIYQINNIVVSGNRIDEIGGNGIALATFISPQNITISDNDISNCDLEMMDGGGIYVCGYAFTSLSIKNNIISDTWGNYEGTPYSSSSGGNGIYLDGDVAGSVAAGNIVFNCRVGIKLHSTYNTTTVNNVLYNNSIGMDLEEDVAGDMYGNNIYNNILLCTKSGQLTWQEYSSGGATVVKGLYDHNLHYNPASNNIISKQAHVYTLAGWRTLSGQDLNSIGADPLVVDALNHDFHLRSNSPCIDAGKDVALTKDFDDNNIPYDGNNDGISVPDIGAYEYMPTVQFTVDSQSIAESAGTATITVQLSAASSQDVTIPFTVSGTAISGSDYTITANSITIPAGATSANITVTIVDSAISEPSKTLVLTMGTPTNAINGETAVYTLTILDNDSLILDNADTTPSSRGVVTVNGTWAASTTAPGYYGSNYIHDGLAGSASKTVVYTPAIPTAGQYKVYIRYTAGSGRASNVPVDIAHDGGTDTVIVNELINGSQWNLLGTYQFQAGSSGNVTIRTLGTNGYVIADAVEFVPVPPVNATFTAASQSIAESAGTATITVQLSATSSQAVTVPFTVLGTAISGSDYTITASPITIPAGATSANITVTMVEDMITEPAKTVVVTMGTPTNAINGATSVHTLTITDNATPIILDNTDTTSSSRGVVTINGTWAASTTAPGYYGSNYIHDGLAGSASKTVVYTPAIPTAGQYKVYIRYTTSSGRASNVPVDIIHDGGTDTVIVNELINGSQWNLLGTYQFQAGSSGNVTIRTLGTNGYVIADAVAFVPSF